MKSLSLIRSFIGARGKLLASGAVFAVATNILQVIVPSYVGKAIDLLGGSFRFRDLYILIGIILLIECIQAVARFLMRYIMIGASWKIENDLRLRLFDHLLRLPLPFYQRARTGDLIARFTNDLAAIRMMVGPAIMYSLNAAVLLPSPSRFCSRAMSTYSFLRLPFPFLAYLITGGEKGYTAGSSKCRNSYPTSHHKCRKT